MKKLKKVLIPILLSGLLLSSVDAMPPKIIKQALQMTSKGWISFRDFEGNQLIYFTNLESYTCGILQVHYSIDSEDLDEVWTLQKCDYKNPLAVTKEKPYLTMPKDSVKSITLQITFADGTDSEIVTIKP